MNPRFLVFSVFAVIAAVLSVFVYEQMAAAPKKDKKSIDFSEAAPLSVPFKVKNPKKLTVPEGLSCEDARSPKYAFAAYESVAQRLFDDVDPDAIEYLDCFLAERDNKQKTEEVRQDFLRNVFDANALYGFLTRQFDSYFAGVVRQGQLRHGTMAWGAGTFGDVALLAYERTRQERFVRLYLDFFERVMDMRDSELGLHDDYHDRVMDAWGSANLGRNAGDPSLWVAHVTHFSIIMKPATGFARLIKSDPALSKYEERADEIIDYFDRAYRQFDVDLKPAGDTGEVWYWRPLVDKFEATNHVHLQGQALLNMYAVTGDEFYADRIRWIIRVFERGVEIDGDGFVAWNYFPYLQISESMNDSNARGHSEYVWKAGLTIPFLYEATQEGFEIDPDIMAATTKTIREHVVADNDLAQYLHPMIAASIPPGENTNSIIGYLSAAVDDPRIENQIVEIIATRDDLFPQGWLASRKLAQGYAYKLAQEKPQ